MLLSEHERLHQEETVFDRIISKEIPANIVYEDDWVLAFHDINPQAPVHVLVIPKERSESFSDFESADVGIIGEYMKRIAKIAHQLKLENGYRVVFNTGKEAQQTVPYIHAHIIGGRQMSWPPG